MKLARKNGKVKIGLNTRLNHVGYLVKDISAAAGLFVQRLGYVVESAVVEDKLQTAFVQFLRLPGDTAWLELVTPSSANSKLANTLHKGAGLHHICYETTDFEALCATLRDQAMFMVGNPAPAEAFANRRIAWFMDRSRFLVEIVESGRGAFSVFHDLSGREKTS